jgi:hypothetical protein
VNERTQIEIKAMLAVVQPIVLDLRRRGYDAGAWVEQRPDHVSVEVRIRVPPAGHPVEAQA